MDTSVACSSDSRKHTFDAWMRYWVQTGFLVSLSCEQLILCQLRLNIHASALPWKETNNYIYFRIFSTPVYSRSNFSRSRMHSIHVEKSKKNWLNFCDYFYERLSTEQRLRSDVWTDVMAARFCRDENHQVNELSPTNKSERGETTLAMSQKHCTSSCSLVSS